MIRGQFCAVLFFCLVGTLAEAGAAQDSASDLFHEGFELLQRNDAKRAIEYFERGLKLEPKNALGHFYLAEALRTSGRTQDAREHYERSLKLDSKSSVAEQARAQLQAATDANPKAQPAAPVRAAGFDEQAMHKAIALADEIADLGPWFSFCKLSDGALAGQCVRLNHKIEERHHQCLVTPQCIGRECSKECDRIRRSAIVGSDGLSKHNNCIIRHQKAEKIFGKVDNDALKKELRRLGIRHTQSEYLQYLEKLGAAPDQVQSLAEYLVTQAEARQAQYDAELLETRQYEMTSFDDRSGSWCAESDEFNERVARAKEIRAEIQKVLAGQGNAVVSPSATSSSSQPERSTSAPSGTAGADEGMTPGRVFRDCPECPEMVVVPAGSFTMGSLSGEVGRDNEGPTHSVTIARPFAVGKYEMIFREWDACVADRACAQVKDEGWGRERRPVINVNYEQAVGYAEWLSKKSGKKYRLLSEAEWEYAARAGSHEAFFWGSETDRACQFANVYDATAKVKRNFSWQNFGCDDGYAVTAPAGAFKPNAFGLYDMLGNVMEWVEDCRNDGYAGAPADGRVWSTGDCSNRVTRGGSWSGVWSTLRSAARGRYGAS